MHVNSESSYKQVPGFDISSNQGSSDRFLVHHGQTESPFSLKLLWTGKRYRFSIQKLFKKVMAKKRDLFVRRHASSLSEMHGQINQNHSSFIQMVVVVEVVKGCSFHEHKIIDCWDFFKDIIIVFVGNLKRTTLTEVKLEPDSHVVLAKHIFIPGLCYFAIETIKPMDYRL